MRYMFKTDYRQDIKLWRHRGDLLWYGLLVIVLLLIPATMGEFYVGELGGVFIFAIAGVGLMLLAGYTGLISLGNAAFLGIGAYTNSVLLAQGVPFVITLPVSGLFTAVFGAAIGLPTLRMSGLYLAIATLAFGSIVGTVFQKWDAVTGGFDGFAVPTPYIFGYPIEGANGIYYLSLGVLIFVLWLSANILRTPLGRAMVAIRDSEVSAQSMGIHLARYKTFAFAISAGMTGLAGALFAHYVRFLAPDAFDVLLSVQFVTIVFVGGLGSLHGAGDRHRARRFAVRHRPHARPGTVAVRAGAGDRDPVRARRHLRPLDEDQALVPGLSAEAPHRIPPAEILRAIGAAAMRRHCSFRHPREVEDPGDAALCGGPWILAFARMTVGLTGHIASAPTTAVRRGCR
jgi:branched-chain amino acid transport system permease protein